MKPGAEHPGGMATLTKAIVIQCGTIDYSRWKTYIQANERNVGISDVAYDDANRRITLTETVQA